MLGLLVLYSEALTLCWTLQPAQDPTVTEYSLPSAKTPSSPSSSSAAAPHAAPCFVEDIFAALRDGVGDSGELTNSSLVLFGFCSQSARSSASVSLDLANKKSSLEVLHPAAVHVSEEEEQGTITLTFDLPRPPSLMTNPVLLLVFESPLARGDLEVAFTSQFLQPNTQAVCISGDTQYVLLTGKSSEGSVNDRWQITAQTKLPHMKQNLKSILIGEKSGSNISTSPLLLFSGGTGTDTRCASGSPPASLQTSFLCEMKRFLGAVLPQEHFASPPLPLDSLQSLPPLSLGLSSSETLLAVMINSTAPTVFGFTSWGSVLPVCHGELALSAALLEELRQRLDQTLVQMTEIIREEEVSPGAKESLGRLKELSALQEKEHATGGSQFRAFLLLKALQTVAQTYDAQRKLRATRADPSSSVRGGVCGLKALTVSLTKLLVGPSSANINNCHGSCAFPLTNGNNHAILLNSHIESGNADERSPCCVPVAYEALEVVDWNADGTFISIKPDAVARECGCR
ncbi:muellerian-inhibiting factor [Oreochromis aureus]|uniref:Anti-mullerian hormone n=1 Tax=Oreochromis aureus TaxID=47969 RepID=A8WC93_OREAU|nr:muellerian-inhibiting factor [Oreochromis aureus]ABW98500.1 anti-mullerian hormone [Oreochromis aureus]